MSVMNCIQRIPRLLKEIQDERLVRFEKLNSYLVQKGSVNEVVFVASGTSYNGAFTCKRFLEAVCDIKVQLHYPNMFVNYSSPMNPDALYVVISQGGTTKLVFEALQKIKSAGYRNISITEDVTSPIAVAADVAIEMGSKKEEYLYRTIGYSTTVATISLMGVMIAKANLTLNDDAVQSIMKDYEVMFESLDEIREKTLVWYEKNKFSLMRRNKAMIAGTNELWPVAQEADIKLMEMVPMMTRSFELEEFIHGPQNAFDDATSFFLLSKQGEDDGKLSMIAKFIKQEIGFCAIIGANTVDDKDLPLNIRSKYFSSLEFITVMQVLAYQLALDHGRDLSRGVNASIKKYVVKSL